MFLIAVLIVGLIEILPDFSFNPRYILWIVIGVVVFLGLLPIQNEPNHDDGE